MKSRFQRLGIQKRIMLYVAVGLAIMFGGFAFVGLLSVGEATELVYEERLAMAYTVAGIIERDFLHVARDVDEVYAGLVAGGQERSEDSAQSLLSHLSETDPFPFFQVTGVWVLAIDGRVEAAAGEPGIGPTEQVAQFASWATKVGETQFAALAALSPIPGSIPFATLVVRLGDPVRSTTFFVAVHTASVNSSAAYRPDSYWRTAPETTTVVTQQDKPMADYHLEVVDATGLTVLRVGGSEKPGGISYHFPMIENLAAQQKAAAILHEPSSGNANSAHVVAAVPLGSSPFYIILEQATDKALAVPMELRKRILLVTTLGFIATLLVAWLTTRQVVKPTEQLTVAAQRMARGDLENPIRVRAQDEVGRLADSLEAMRKRLSAAYQEVSRAKVEAEMQVKQRTNRLTEVLGKAISAQEEERRRLARELHDETAQTIGALSIALDRVRYGVQDAPVETVDQIQEAQSIVKRLLEDTRRLILDLRPLALEDLGLVPAIRWYAETHLQEHGVETTVEADQPEVRMPPHLEVALFRIVQEAINNIAKHAEARHARIRLSFRDSVACVLVSDDGKGFHVDSMVGPGSSDVSFGLLGMEERARLLNGRLDIRSEAGKGTQVIVEAPIP